MNAKKFSDAMSELDIKYVEEALHYKKNAKRTGWIKWGAMAACFILVLSMGTVALAATLGYDPIGWILSAFSANEDGPSAAVIQEQMQEGQWVYLNDDNIAVILPESPTEILLSHDCGKTWKESAVAGSDKMILWGEWKEDVVPTGGFIGFWGDGGYLVLTAPVAMGNQPMRIYLTHDGGETWSEIGNPYQAGEHYCVLTGAGFSTDQIGFISYRYYEDAGPDIWWTSDGGDTWKELNVTLPEQYTGEEYVFTPQSPAFHGSSGVYPIKVCNQSDGAVEMIYLYSDDYGMTWEFR